MRSNVAVLVLCFGSVAAALFGCGGEQAVDMSKVLAQEKTFVGSETCKTCHLEHYDSWKMTLHSRMTQDAQANPDAIIAPIDEAAIREDLAKLDKLKVPADQIYVPKASEIKYTIGSQWKQRYIVEKEGTLYISPIQYNADTHRWVNYNEDKWDKKPWLQDCGGCHATGWICKSNPWSNWGSPAKPATAKAPTMRPCRKQRYLKNARPSSIRPS